MIGRQLAVAILIIAFLVSIALAASAGPLRAENPPSAASSATGSARHLIGTIDSKSSDQKSFVLNLKSGHHVTVRINSSTSLLEFSPTKKSLTMQDLPTGSRIAVASTKSPPDFLQARLVVLLPNSSSDYRIIRGTVTDLTTSAFTLISPGNKSLQVSLTSATIYSKKDRNVPSLVTLSDLSDSDQVLIVGSEKDNTLTTKLVHIIKP